MDNVKSNGSTITINVSKLAAILVGILLTMIVSMVGYFVNMKDSQLASNSIRLDNMETRFERHISQQNDAMAMIIERLARVEEKQKIVIDTLAKIDRKLR